jgi:hypothetical protein
MFSRVRVLRNLQRRLTSFGCDRTRRELSEAMCRIAGKGPAETAAEHGLLMLTATRLISD